jgi:hypothetical protein
MEIHLSNREERVLLFQRAASANNILPSPEHTRKEEIWTLPFQSMLTITNDNMHTPVSFLTRHFV